MHSDKALSISIKPLAKRQKALILYLTELIKRFYIWHFGRFVKSGGPWLEDFLTYRMEENYTCIKNSTRESSSRSYKELNIPSPNIGLSRLLLVLLTHTTYNAMASFITQTSAKNEPHKHQNSILSDSRDLIRCCGMTLKHLKRRCTPHYIVIAVSDQIRKRSVNGCTNCCIFWIHLGDFLGGKL